MALMALAGELILAVIRGDTAAVATHTAALQAALDAGVGDGEPDED